MNFQSPEKIKPFRLVKYFTFISLILIFLGTIIMSTMIMHRARAMLLKKTEDYALVLAENLNHQIFLQFVIPVALKFGKIQLRNKKQFERMDRVIKGTLHSFKVVMVNIYDMDNTISYSFDLDLMGKKNLGGIGYKNAASGTPSSRLLQKGSFFELLIGTPQESKLITYVPLRAEKPMAHIAGPILGILELVQDLSEDYKAIMRFQLLIILIFSIVMGVLFLILRYVVKRGEKIIQKRAEERLKLEEQLSQAERFASLGKLTAGISHEIRNPLGIITSSAQLLKKKMTKFDSSNTLPDVIVEEANRLNDIVSDFLQLSKPRNPDFILCQVEDILEKNLTFLKPQFQKNKYIVQKKYDSFLPMIMADINLLYQTFLNILINAMQAMPGGGGDKYRNYKQT
ncbi:histidine kinase [Candidatus Magnetomoraceae bacterium gMMP-1]